MNNIKEITLATADDIDEIEVFYNEINDHLAATTNYTNWARGFYPARADAELGVAAKCLFILRIDGALAASVILNHEANTVYDAAPWGIQAQNHETIFVHTLTVHPNFHKQGLASKLLHFAQDHARELGVKTIRFDVATKNIPAIALYEKLGFQYVDTVDLLLPHWKWFRLYEMVM